MFSKLSGTFLDLRSALDCGRNSTEKGVKVQNVAFQDDRDANAGNVSHTAPSAADGIATAPLAIADARMAPMAVLEKRQLEPAPSPLKPKK